MRGDGMDTGQDATEPDLVSVCRDVRAGHRDPGVFDAAFARARIFAQRWEKQPGVMASTLPGQGRWVLAFSTHERLVRQVGDVPWLSTTGADLLEQLSRGLGVLLDIGDDHGLPLLPQPDARARFDGALLPSRPTIDRHGTRSVRSSSQLGPNNG